MWPHNCTRGSDQHGLEPLPCRPPWHFWVWCPVRLVRQLLRYAPLYRLSLDTTYALQPCPVSCGPHTCLCGPGRAIVPVWRGEDDVSEDDTGVLWTLLGRSLVALWVDGDPDEQDDA